MPSLLETVTSLLRQGDNLERLGAMLGTDAEQASALVDLATPVVITGLADRAFDPGGSDVVVRLLDGVDPSIVDNPLVFVERGDPTIGEGLLLSIFAGDYAALTTTLADRGNVAEPVISRLLPGILALAIGVLGRRRAVRGVDEAGVLELLAAEKSGLPADRVPDRGAVDDGFDRNRTPAMAGAAAPVDDSVVSSAPAERGRTTAGPGETCTGTESGSPATSAASIGTADNLPADRSHGEPPDQSMNRGEVPPGSTDRDERGPLAFVVGGLTAVVLLAWALSQLGGGAAETVEAGSDGNTDLRDEPIAEPNDDAILDPAEEPPVSAGQPDESSGEADTETETETDTDTESESPDDAVAAEAGGETSEPVTINEVLSLDPITFEVNSATITDEGLAVLGVAAEYLKADPELSIEIAGHTDSDGDAADNMRLSQNRADEVEAYLESLGIDGARMNPIGYGENEPVASNDTKAGKAQNRRIEFIIQ